MVTLEVIEAHLTNLL